MQIKRIVKVGEPNSNTTFCVEYEIVTCHTCGEENKREIDDTVKYPCTKCDSELNWSTENEI